MSNIFNKKTVAKNKASVGDDSGKSYTYKGFSSANQSKNFKLYDIDLVKQDIINHFHIRKGEKLENPSFGTVIWDLLYENFTPAIKDEISKNVQEIINYDPRIRVNQIAIDTTEQGIRIEAEIVYLPFNVTERMKFDFDAQNGIVS
jgi:phage baseplate assembly protein W